jgi:hypothetical protein
MIQSQMALYIVIKLKTLHVTKQYTTKWYCYKMEHRHYDMVHNSTLQSQSTGLHQPMDWLGIKPNLT